MPEERLFLTVEQAISCLNEGDSIHTFLNSPGILVGADCSRESVIETLQKHSNQIEIGGVVCRRMKHGLVVWRGDEPVFIEANEEKLKAIEIQVTKQNMRKIIINDQPCTVDSQLSGYEILSKPSSNVEFYGTDGQNIFIQFKNGSSYLYLNVTKDTINAMYLAESIGKFISFLSKNYTYTKVEGKLVNIVKEEAA